jgi:DNA modification methylase
MKLSLIKIKKTHPDRFPVELPLRCLKLSGKNMVLDPFFGSGTTGVAATLIGRKWIGIEKDKGTADLALRRIKRALSRFNDI